MRIAVLGSPSSWYVRDLQRASAEKHQIEPVTFRDLHSHVAPGGIAVGSGSRALNSYDALLVRTMPPGSLEQVVFRMDALAQLAAAGQLIINPPHAIEAAVDKYLALTRLQAAGLPVPRTVVCQSTEDALRVFAELGGDVVIKPLFGAEGRGIARVSDEEIAWRTFKLLDETRSVIYLQQYIEHEGFDLRFLVLGHEVLGMKRAHASDWRTNVSRGATTESFPVDRRWANLARRAAEAVGAVLAGIDVLPARSGEFYVLEVNAVPGWRALARTLQLDIADRVLRLLCHHT